MKQSFVEVGPAGEEKPFGGRFQYGIAVSELKIILNRVASHRLRSRRTSPRRPSLRSSRLASRSPSSGLESGQRSRQVTPQISLLSAVICYFLPLNAIGLASALRGVFTSCKADQSNIRQHSHRMGKLRPDVISHFCAPSRPTAPRADTLHLSLITDSQVAQSCSGVAQLSWSGRESTRISTHPARVERVSRLHQRLSGPGWSNNSSF